MLKTLMSYVNKDVQPSQPRWERKKIINFICLSTVTYLLENHIANSSLEIFYQRSCRRTPMYYLGLGEESICNSAIDK